MNHSLEIVVSGAETGAKIGATIGTATTALILLSHYLRNLSTPDTLARKSSALPLLFIPLFGLWGGLTGGTASSVKVVYDYYVNNKEVNPKRSSPPVPT